MRSIRPIAGITDTRPILPIAVRKVTAPRKGSTHRDPVAGGEEKADIGGPRSEADAQLSAEAARIAELAERQDAEVDRADQIFLVGQILAP